MKAFASRFLVCLLFSGLVGLSLQVKAQLSPLFETPSLNLDLPIFNPAFTGDSESHRVYASTAFQNVAINGFTRDWSFLAGYDNKFAAGSSEINFTYGTSLIYNSLSLFASDPDIDPIKYNYGNWDVSFGIRFPFSYVKKHQQQAGAKSKKPRPFSNKKKTGLVDNLSEAKLSKEQNISVSYLFNNDACSFHSPTNYLAFNAKLEYNFATLTNTDGNLILNNQIVPNAIGSGPNPFTFNRVLSDPTVGDGNLENAGSIDIGLGALYHHYFDKLQSHLRLSLAIHHVARGFQGVPSSGDQQIAPLKVLQFSYFTPLKFLNNAAILTNVLYLDQSTSRLPFQGQSEFDQWRVDFSLNQSTRQVNSIKKEGIWLRSIEPGLSIYHFNGTIPVVSLFVSARIRSNVNGNRAYRGNSKNIGIKANRLSGNDFHVFLNWDLPTSRDFPLPETYGNLRWGVIWQPWDGSRS